MYLISRTLSLKRPFTVFSSCQLCHFPCGSPCPWPLVCSSIKWEQWGCRLWLWQVIFLIPLAGKQNWNAAIKESECRKGCCRTFGAILPVSTPPPYLDRWRKWGLERLGNLLKVIRMLFIMTTYFNVVLDSINSLVSLHNLSAAPWGGCITPILQITKLRSRERMWLAHGHRDSLSLLNPGEQERGLQEEHWALPLKKCIPTCSYWIYILVLGPIQGYK